MRKVRSIGLPYWIMVGAAIGIVLGVLFGDYASILKPLGSAYIGLLQMVIYPYIVCSLLHGLGRLAPATALKLLKSGAVIFLMAIVGVFAAIYILGLAIPETRPPVVISPAATSTAAQLVALLIPTNPFDDLTNNYVPAIVLLGVVYGIAIQRFDNKEGLLTGLDVVRRASAKIWNWVVYVAPFGVLALFADLAGTIQIDELGGIAQYLVLFCVGALIIGFVVIPALASALTPVGYREMIGSLKSALVMSISTSLLVAAVPGIIQFGQQLAARLGIEEEDRDAIVATTVAVVYALAEFGNWFIGLFIMFAAHFYDHALSLTQLLLLPLMTILSTVGSPTSTVLAAGFLAEWIGLPEEAQFLYVETSAVTRYPQVLLSAMGLALIMMLIVLSYYGKRRVNARKLIAAGTASIVAVAGLAAVASAARPFLTPADDNPYLAFSIPSDLVSAVDVTIHRQTPADNAGASGGATDNADGNGDRSDGYDSIIQRIQGTQTLRVGYNPNVIPFSYFNSNNDLVGYDIEIVYALARDLNADVEFIPFGWETLSDDLTAERFDIAIGGIYVTDDRLETLAITDFHLVAPVALIAPSDEAGQLLDLGAQADGSGLTIAAFRDPVIVPLADTLFPAADVRIVETYDAIVGDESIDAALWTLPQARAWAEVHPGYSAVEASDLGAPIPMAFFMPPGADELVGFVNYWQDLRGSAGDSDALREYWLEGKPRTSGEPRWSVMRNVLGWVD